MNTKEYRLKKALKGAEYQVKNAEPVRLEKAKTASVFNRRVTRLGHIEGSVARVPDLKKLKKFPKDAFTVHEVRINGIYVRCTCSDMKYNSEQRGASSCLHAIALSLAFLNSQNIKNNKE